MKHHFWTHSLHFRPASLSLLTFHLRQPRFRCPLHHYPVPPAFAFALSYIQFLCHGHSDDLFLTSFVNKYYQSIGCPSLFYDHLGAARTCKLCLSAKARAIHLGIVVSLSLLFAAIFTTCNYCLLPAHRALHGSEYGDTSASPDHQGDLFRIGSASSRSSTHTDG